MGVQPYLSAVMGTDSLTLTCIRVVLKVRVYGSEPMVSKHMSTIADSKLMLEEKPSILENLMMESSMALASSFLQKASYLQDFGTETLCTVVK